MVIELKNNDETLYFRDTNHFEETTGTFDATQVLEVEPEA
jgi:hypothetical protein